MRETENDGWIVQNSARALLRTLRFAAVALGIGLVMTAGVARAEDDEEDDSTFEERFVKNLMSGLGATNMENKGIDYRERSPLVVPPRIDLPPPASSTEAKAPNWPKDPDESRRKAAIAERKKRIDPYDSGRTLKPSELNVAGKGAPARAGNDSNRPGESASNIMLSPAQLGYSGGLKGLFGGTNTEAAQFKGEPTRESLTEPPPGYQTPSPNFAYGVGPKEALESKKYDSATGRLE